MGNSGRLGVILALLVAAVVGALTLAHPGAANERAEAAPNTPSPTATATAPAAVSAAPTNLRLTGAAEGLAWNDNSTDETGFVVTATDRVSGAQQTFRVPANSTSFQLPPAAQPSCIDRRPSMGYDVVAVNPIGASRPASVDIHSSCATGEPIPQTPPPASPTPGLPEQGGPAGGVLSGHLYVDNDGSRTRSQGDGIYGASVTVVGLDADGSAISYFGVGPGTDGLWQVRSLPDGNYRVQSEPGIPEDQFSLTIPPVTDIVANPRLTFHVQAISARIVGGGRVTDIDFGIPPQLPFAGAKVTLPNTGRSGAGGSATLWLLVGGLALSIAAAGVLTVRRR